MSELGERSRQEPGASEEVRARALVVVGMHRSGTSAVTRLLNLLGADLPRNLMPPTAENNAPGFWEAREIAEAQDALLAVEGSSWHDVAPRPESWFESAMVREAEDHLLAILERDFSGSNLFVIKDPRICRLIPLWLRVLERLGADCSFILPVRNPLEVASSLEERDGFSLAKSLVLWLRHVLEAERHTRGRPRSWVFYADLLSDWRSVVEKLGEDLDLDRAPLAPETEAEIEGFLSERHRHHTFSRRDLQARPEVTEWVKRAYAAATQVDEAPEALSEIFDDVAGELAEADRAFGPLLTRALPMESGSPYRRATEIEALRGELDRRDRELAEARRGGELLSEQLQQERQRADAARASVAELETELARSERRAEQVQAELEKVQGLLRTVLSSRLFRYTRPLRRVWYRLKKRTGG